MNLTARSTSQSPDLRSRRTHGFFPLRTHFGLKEAAPGLSASISRTRPGAFTRTPITSALFCVWNRAEPLPFTFTVAACAAAGRPAKASRATRNPRQERPVTVPVSAQPVRGRCASCKASVKSPVVVEALPGLATDEAGLDHPLQARGRRHPLLAQALPERLGGVGVDVQADQVGEGERAHRPAGAEPHGAVDVLRRR